MNCFLVWVLWGFNMIGERQKVVKSRQTDEEVESDRLDKGDIYVC